MAQRVNESIEVDAPVDDVFRYWSNFENFPTFMSNVEVVRMAAQDTSHWRVKGPLGKSVEFEAKTTEMDPNRGIGWNTVDGEVMTSGEVRFGETTFGTGTVLSEFVLRDGSSILLGVAEWLTPDGDFIRDTGITPDVRVPLPEGTEPLSPDDARDLSRQEILEKDAQLRTAYEKLQSQ